TSCKAPYSSGAAPGFDGCTPLPAAAGIAGERRRRRAGEGGALRLRLGIEVKQQIERVEKRCNEVEQRPKPHATSEQIVFADGELGEALKTCGIAGDQVAAAQERGGRVAAVESACARVSECGGGIRER